MAIKNYFFNVTAFENPCDIVDICAQICIPTQDSYKCDCYKGFTLMADGISCRPEKKQTGHVDRHVVSNARSHSCYIKFSFIDAS